MKESMKTLLSALLAFASVSFAADPIRVMLLDGESGGPYHKWKLTTPVLRKQLEETGLFHVDVVTAPPAGADFSAFKPDFGKYAVVVWNYDAPDDRWPAELKASFEKYVHGGGGFVSVHAADNAFPNWPAFNEMIGLGGWRGRERWAVLVLQRRQAGCRSNTRSRRQTRSAYAVSDRSARGSPDHEWPAQNLDASGG